MEQALADEARELRAELEAERKSKDAKRKASFRNTDPTARQNTARNLLETNDNPVSARRGSIAGSNVNAANSTSTNAIPAWAPTKSRFDPHTSFQRRRADDDDDDWSFEVKTAPTTAPTVTASATPEDVPTVAAGTETSTSAPTAVPDPAPSDTPIYTSTGAPTFTSAAEPTDTPAFSSASHSTYVPPWATAPAYDPTDTSTATPEVAAPVTTSDEPSTAAPTAASTAIGTDTPFDAPAPETVPAPTIYENSSPTYTSAPETAIAPTTRRTDIPIYSSPPETVIAPTTRRSKRPSGTGSKARAMASVYGKAKFNLPGDLGANDPRKKSLPGDLGPNDPRRKSDGASKSQSPSSRIPHPKDEPSTKPRRASDGALLRKAREDDEGGVRLNKDYEDAVGSSEDDYEGDTDASTDGRRGRDRGRGNARVGKAVGVNSDSEDSDINRGRSQKSVHGSSPLSPDPTITVTPPISDRRKTDVHPHSSYDHPFSTTSTPRHSDDEEHWSDLRRAQRLSLTISPVHSTPSAHRVIRQIIRGDYGYFQREAEEGRRRQRVYLVATDLSPEAEYALEWTIGTVLRDGDTLLALYAVGEEGGTGVGEGIEIGHGADVVKDTASIVGSLPAERVAQSPGPNPLGKLQREGSTARGPDEKGGMGRAERERYQAAENISDRCVKLLRKTRLQIRVVVEVFHCKSPRHMITEVVSSLPFPLFHQYEKPPLQRNNPQSVC